MARKLTLPIAFLLLVTSMMGTGVIMLPKGFADVGYISGSVLLIILSLASFFTLYAMCYCADLVQTVPVTYYSTCKNINKYIAYMADISIAFHGFGCSVAYLMAMRNWISELFNVGNKYSVVLYLFFPLLLISIRNDLGSLQYVSYLSLISVFYLGFILIYLYFTVNNDDKTIKPFNSNIGSGLPILIFALGCHQNIITVFSNLKNKSLGRMTIVALLSTICGTTFYLAIGLFGYLLIGDTIKGPILDYLRNFNISILLVNISIGGFIFVMICAFPMHLHPARKAIIELFYEISKHEETEQNHNRLSKSLTVIFTIGCTGLALIPGLDITGVIGIVGSTASNMIIYGFPSLIYLISAKNFKFLTVIACFIFISSILLMIFMLFNQLVSEKM
ncbi:Vacuolar amino acid transporter 5 [Astathelohania contejeani]|uniref:Vacuolar amino acid transporter 5 n=1 Tax=Astathelohania contejeani TaxID=164912 RepID=A0ABQ7I049_9MICR|nr:Vacuolar amino acid transporter 5 [Thelohania contejeani]